MAHSSTASDKDPLYLEAHDDDDERRNLCGTFWKRLGFVGVAVVIGVVSVLGLSIGLGLGLGLRHRDHVKFTTPAIVTVPLQSSPPSNFVLNGLKGQPPQTRVYAFNVSNALGAPDGVVRPMLVVNGMFPGPTIEANQGDRIIINVTNNMDVPTSIHWHGLFQNQTNFYDGTSGITECGIPPGQFLVYKFGRFLTFTFGEFSGTTWWHAPHESYRCAHTFTDYSTQYADGITGALIVHPSEPSPPDFPTWDQDLVVQMNDWYHTFSSQLSAAYLSPFGIDGTAGDEPVPESGTLNGLGQYGQGGNYFNFTLEPNKTYRLRLINSGSFASIRFSIDNHPLTVIEAEGTLVKPYTVSGVTIAVAQRYSVLIHTNQTVQQDGTFWMRANIQTDMFTYVVWGQNTDVRGILRYSTAPNLAAVPVAADDPGPGMSWVGDMDTSLLVPAVVDSPPERTRMYLVVVALENTADGRFLAFMNRTSWEPLSGTTSLLLVREAGLERHNATSFAPVGGSLQDGDQFYVTEDSIQVVDLLINNLDDGDHPFHLHGFRPWV
ncbi:hypothetical protein NLI96_g5633 [Meripilus lineatus]|uniref:laccase n=1 Tax=Meripilus lineatus TaxID=2056292 RepID=A0AAD5V4E9_9APHY|nr:hypothetical protein NLI96_g5633 [Physisporinus lineatus]